jgi:formate dehydrogenase maturation protein FdhE
MLIPYALKCDAVAKQERLELIQAAFSATNRAVKFISRETLCPVCLLIGLQSPLKVTSTTEEIRYCMCLVCGCTVKAVGEAVKKPETIAKKEIEQDTKVRKAKSKTKKRGKK